jgi:hypothetical protein
MILKMIQQSIASKSIANGKGILNKKNGGSGNGPVFCMGNSNQMHFTKT